MSNTAQSMTLSQDDLLFLMSDKLMIGLSHNFAYFTKNKFCICLTGTPSNYDTRSWKKSLNLWVSRIWLHSLLTFANRFQFGEANWIHSQTKIRDYKLFIQTRFVLVYAS